MRRLLVTLFSCLCLTIVSGANTFAGDDKSIKLSSSAWLGNLKLEDTRLKAIKKAMEKALDAPVDSEQQCGEVRGDCVVRAAREWRVEGDKFREVVVYLHTIGQASNVVGQIGGKWPDISTH